MTVIGTIVRRPESKAKKRGDDCLVERVTGINMNVTEWV